MENLSRAKQVVRSEGDWAVFVHPPRLNEELKGRKIDRATMRRAWGFAHPYRKQLGMYLAVTVIGTFFGVIPAFLFRSIIDKAIPDKNTGFVGWLVAGIIGVAALSAVLGFVARWTGAVLGEGIISDMRIALFKHVGRMPISFFTRTQTGALMSRLNNDVVGAQQAFTFILRSTVTDLLTVVMTTVAMLRLNWIITVLTLLIVPPMVFISRRVGKVQEKAAREQMRLNGELHSTMTERFNVAGALLVMLFGHRKDEDKKFSDTASSVARIGVRRAITGMSLTIGLPLIGSVGVAAVYWWGSLQVIRHPNHMTIGTMIAMATLVQRLYGPLTDLASARVDFVTAFVSFDRIFEVLDAPHPIADAPNAIALPASPTGASVSFRNVTFAYPDDALVPSLETGSQRSNTPAAELVDVLRGVSFEVPAGTFTAIVGPSGAGKSTVSSLIPRLFDVSTGAVLLDGHDVKSLQVESLRDAVGVVSQDAHMFHSSIAENLRYAKPDATDAELIAACTAASIHEMISTLPDGYNTVVGERGYRLSGGEKQRMALARVLLKAPRVVILDEATAHLDSETELDVQRALESTLRGRTTTVAIAHRLATIQHADQILVVEDGQIVERGTHSELASAGGLYANLRSAQELVNS